MSQKKNHTNKINSNRNRRKNVLEERFFLLLFFSFVVFSTKCVSITLQEIRELNITSDCDYSTTFSRCVSTVLQEINMCFGTILQEMCKYDIARYV